MSAADTALRLIAKNGRHGVVLRRPSADATDSGKPWAPGDADPLVMPIVAQDLDAVVLELGSLSPQMAQSVAPEATAVALVAAMSFAQGIEPLVGDIIETGGLRYAVLKAELLMPASQRILYTLSLKAK